MLSVSVEAPLLIIDDSFDDLTGGVDPCELKSGIGCSTGHFVLLSISVNPTSNLLAGISANCATPD
jgi:hypothetical protein